MKSLRELCIEEEYIVLEQLDVVLSAFRKDVIKESKHGVGCNWLSTKHIHKLLDKHFGKVKEVSKRK